ncbi:PLP-dependent aminotransferase family protein [Nakamurella silvestris]|nr:PLP-dependent aminotransferase family protein [Nakamurella silvestris]
MRARSTWTPRLADSQAPPADRLVTALATDILDGRLHPGERLPAHRVLALELGIAIGTVSKAYAILERRGLVRGSHGQGMFVAYLPPPDLGQIDLASNMPPPMLADSVVADAIVAVSSRIGAADLANLGPPGGRLEHRRTMAAWVAATGLELDPEQLILCNGAQQAIAAILLSLGPDSSLVSIYTEEFTFPGALSYARQAGHPVHPVAIDEQGMIPAHLDRVLAGRSARTGFPPVVYVTPTLHNPTAATMRGGRRRELVRVARRHDALIIEDDVYALSEDRPAAALVELAPERTYYISSASKALSPGIRIGLIRPPIDRRSATAAAVRALSLPVSPLLCELLRELLDIGVAADIRQAIRTEGNRRTDLARRILGSTVLKAASNGYHAFAPMDRARAGAVVRNAEGAGVLLTSPEALMADPSGRRSGIRICLGAPTFADLTRGLGIVGELIRGSGSASESGPVDG